MREFFRPTVAALSVALLSASFAAMSSTAALTLLSLVERMSIPPRSNPSCFLIRQWRKLACVGRQTRGGASHRLPSLFSELVAR